MTIIYELTLKITFRRTGSDAEVLELRDTVEVYGSDLRSVLKLLAELDAYTRQQAGLTRP